MLLSGETQEKGRDLVGEDDLERDAVALVRADLATAAAGQTTVEPFYTPPSCAEPL